MLPTCHSVSATANSEPATTSAVITEHSSRSEQFLDNMVGCSGSRLNRKDYRGLYTELFYAIIPVLFPYFLQFWYPYISKLFFYY